MKLRIFDMDLLSMYKKNLETYCKYNLHTNNHDIVILDDFTICRYTSSVNEHAIVYKHAAYDRSISNSNFIDNEVLSDNIINITRDLYTMFRNDIVMIKNSVVDGTQEPKYENFKISKFFVTAKQDVYIFIKDAYYKVAPNYNGTIMLCGSDKGIRYTPDMFNGKHCIDDVARVNKYLTDNNHIGGDHIIVFVEFMEEDNNENNRID